MFDKKIDKKEALDLKNYYIHHLDRRKEIMKNTSSKVEDLFGDKISKNSSSPEQTFKLYILLAKIM